jgi:nucleoside-diphosphate-sugar epimerase
MPSPNPLATDLDHILTHTEGLWDELRGQRLFVTGGTGFFGTWLLETFVWANDRFGLGASATVLTRDPGAFRAKAPHLGYRQAIRFHVGDIRAFTFPPPGYSHVIHAATPASAALNDDDPLLMADTIIEGTRRVLDCAVACGARKFLLTSSGAVYGPQPPDLANVSEQYTGGPDPTDPRSAYGEGKRLSELLCAIYHRQHRVEAKIARCFAFVGPYLPLNLHFAIGNFIRDGMQGRIVEVRGDGTPVRSYLYVADLMVWLWTILFRGEPCHPYNVGSEESLSIADLAREVAITLGPGREVRIHGTPNAGLPQRYVPSTARARTELALQQWVPLSAAIRRTAEWARPRTASTHLVPEPGRL